MRGVAGRSGRKERRALAWAFLLGASGLCLAALFAILPMWGDPDIVVEASSDAVVFSPSRSVDLVQRARPRFALNADGSRFAGVVLDPALPAGVFAEAIASAPELAALDGRIVTIRELTVSPGCAVRLESWPGGVRLELGRARPAEPCTIDGELGLYDPQFGTRPVPFEPTDIALERSAILTLRTRPWPLILRDLPVAELGFTTLERTSPRSSIRNAVVDLPRYGRRTAAYAGDLLSLGTARGELVELTLGDSLTALFKGTSADPTLEGRRLEPMLLAQLSASDSFMRALAIAFSLATFVVGYYQVVEK